MTSHLIDRDAVIGNPIAHSKAPLIPSEFAQQTHQQLSYTAELVEPGKVSEFVADFQKNNGKGLNITVPFKEDAYRLATQLSERAQRAGAVNTLTLNGPDDYSADTTDGVGLVTDLLANHQLTLKQKNILMLGAGGAVRGVLEPLLDNRPGQLIIANRTVEKHANWLKIFLIVFLCQGSIGFEMGLKRSLVDLIGPVGVCGGIVLMWMVFLVILYTVCMKRPLVGQS